MSDSPKDTDDWGNGKTYAEMRRLCPDPRLSAYTRNDPIELAAIASGFNSWDAWNVYSGDYYDVDTYLEIVPFTQDGGFEITWSGGHEDIFGDRNDAIEQLRQFAMALLRITSKATTGTMSATITVEEAV